MGDWRTVNIEGSCDFDDIDALERWVSRDFMHEGWHCLCSSDSICGLPMWAGLTISAKGNLGERDFDENSVFDALKGIAPSCPSLELKVHCGGPYESADCVATVVVKKGEVAITRPEIAVLETLSDADLESGFMRALLASR